MFLDNGYVLGSELAEVGKFHLANISMYIKEEHDRGNFDDVKKLGKATYINKDAVNLPKYFIKNLNKCSCIDNMLPVTYLTKELGVKYSNLKIALSNYIIKEVRVGTDDLIEFSDEFVNLFKGKVHYTLSNKECNECLNKKLIDGFIKLTKNRFLVWY